MDACLFKAEYNNRSKKALAFSETAIAETILYSTQVFEYQQC